MATLHLWFFSESFFGGFSYLRMSPRLIVMIIRHLPRCAPGLPIIPYPSFRLGNPAYGGAVLLSADKEKDGNLRQFGQELLMIGAIEPRGKEKGAPSRSLARP